MKKVPLFLTLGNLLIALLFCFPEFIRAESQQSPQYESQKILIQFSSALNIHTESQAQEVLGKYLGKLNYPGTAKSPVIFNVKKVVGQSGRGPIFSFHLENLQGFDIPQLAQELKKIGQDEIVAASANYLGHTNGLVFPSSPNEINSPSPIVNPNDFYYASEGSWGQNYKDQYGVWMLKLNEVWSFEKGDPDIAVAVIDTGAYIEHPELIDRVWRNMAELNGQPGRDDDNNGWIDDFFGVNVVGDGPESPDVYDDNGHGTAVAGIIGAETDNDLYMSAVNWRSPVVVIKAFDAQGEGNVEDMLQALDYASNHSQVRVINISASFPPEARELLDGPIYTAYLNKKIVVSSAGHVSGNDDLAFNVWPANHTLSVRAGSVTHNQQLSNFSRTGLGAINVASPGGGDSQRLVREITTTLDGGVLESSTDILSLASPVVGPEFRVGDALVRMKGTSFASAFTSGVVSLLVSRYPDIPPEEIMSRLEESALDNDLGDAGQDASFGYGLINTKKALTMGTYSKMPRGYITAPGYMQTISKANGTLPIAGLTLGDLEDSSYIYTLSLREGNHEGDLKPAGWNIFAQGDLEMHGFLAHLDLSSLTAGKIYTLHLETKNSLGVSNYFVVFNLKE